MTIETRLKLDYLLSQYKSKYEKYYPKSQFEFVMENFVKNFETTDGITSLLLQAYEECGLSEELQCNINGDLLKEGCGIIPSLAKSLKKQQTSETITVREPLRIPKYGILRIIQSNFTEKNDVSNYSLIYGTFTCEAPIPMIKSSFEKDVDLYLLLCGCASGIFVFDYREYLFELDSRMEDLSIEKGRDFDILECEDLPFPLIKTFR